jgi:hypothetical protein
VLREIDVSRPGIISQTHVITFASFQFMCKRNGLDSGTPECHDHPKLLVVGTPLNKVCCLRLLTETLSYTLAIWHVYQRSMSSQTTVYRKDAGLCNKKIKDRINTRRGVETHGCRVCRCTGIRLIRFAGFIITGSFLSYKIPASGKKRSGTQINGTLITKIFKF